MLIRAELPGDVGAVRLVNEAAFGTTLEADLVDRLRVEAFPVVSLVGEHDGAVVGHILFSPVTLGDDGGVSIMGLGPMAVLPDHQRRGIGVALMNAGLDACRLLGAGGVVVLGHAAYYPRVGFVPASRFSLTCEYAVPDDVFMAIELRPGALAGKSGTIRYHRAFADAGA